MKDQALWLYRKFTAARRQRLQQDLRNVGQLPIGVLFYHRVANRHPNTWTLSRRDFSRQLDWLQKHYDIVSLAEAQQRIRGQYCDRPTISITFDDGYAENAHFAIPELLRRNLPATYFVATEFVRTGKHFPHDVQAGCLLEPNTIEDLRDFAEHGIEIGAHTRNHLDLGQVRSPGQLRDEIQGSIDDLQAWLGRQVRYFAFPFGLPCNTSQAAVDVLEDAGIAGFCTAYGAWNWPGDRGFHLRRIHADAGLEKLKNWLTYDPRKLHDQEALPFVEPQLRSPRREIAAAPQLHTVR
ncbi:MAG: polysaccharide deacetylase family protein [Planctomycetales bacterium]|nr:polysaccharide deacetylase family protein [Planctomycetales bacterium]